MSAGIFVSIDGPDGVGKSTVVRLVADQLGVSGLRPYATAEPTSTDLGRVIREGVSQYRGLALACLVAGDRYYHLDSEILPRMREGYTVISDRYFLSSLVQQRIDGVSLDLILQMHANITRPDLAVLLTARPDVILARLEARGQRTRFDKTMELCRTQVELYKSGASLLKEMAWPILELDSTQQAPGKIAKAISRDILMLRNCQAPQ